MLTKLMAATDGKKTYIFVIIWMVYRIAVSKGWFVEAPILETFLLGGAGLSLRDGVAKSKG